MAGTLEAVLPPEGQFHIFLEVDMQVVVEDMMELLVVDEEGNS